MSDFDFLALLEPASDEAPCEDELALQNPSDDLAIQQKLPDKPVYQRRRNFASLKGRVGKGRHSGFAERALLACHMRDLFAVGETFGDCCI